MIAREEYKKMAVLAARVADEKKAEDILLLDLRRMQQGLSDFLLILSANSRVHLRTLYDAIEETLGKMSLLPVHRDGLQSAQWCILDYGGFLVHVFHRDARAFYSLERLWESPKKIAWQEKGSPIKPKHKKFRKS